MENQSTTIRQGNEIVSGVNRKKKNKLLRLANLNAQSLGNKMNEFEFKVTKVIEPQIISITESWGNEGLDDSFFNLKGYKMYRDDRERRGGGALLYIKSELDQRECKALKALDYESSAWCWVIEKGGKKTLVGSVYRSTSSSPENNAKLLNLIEKANEIVGDNRLLLLGDFNVPRINWEEKDLERGAQDVEINVLDTINDCFLHQHVREITRRRNEQESTLDLIFTKEEDDVKNIKVLPPLGDSDHGIVVADYVSEWISKVEFKPRRMYHKGNYDRIIEELGRINWELEFENKTVHESWEIFKIKLKALIEEYIPMTKHKDYNEPWMNGKLMRHWKRKYFAWKRFTESQSYQRYREYKRETDVFKKQTRKAKRAYEKNLAKGIRNNKRAFFRYVNSKLTVRPEITEMQNELGELFGNDKDICDILGKYFNSVYIPQNNDDMPEMEVLCEQEIQDIQITREAVQKKLEKLNVTKSCGPDNMHPFVLQKTASVTCIPLELIFKKSLEDGECPEDWRSANVTPIHKKGDRTDPSNYRPVSLTSQICKVMESLIREHVLKHLTENNILRDEQHGFREGRSCLTNLLEIVEQWTEIIDDGDCIDIAYLDFRKAFDLVSHTHLLFKMSKYGITGQTLKWVKAFLHQRTQRVVVRGTASGAFNVTSGVPQGSVLGPVLFLIFINDLPLEILSPLSLFADDSKIFTRIISEKNKSKKNLFQGNEVLQRDLNTIREWAQKWKMEFNVDKCKIMHIGRTNPKQSYNMGGTNLTVTTEEKDLGVLVDDELEFDKHIRAIVNKANRMLGMIRRGFTCLDKEIFLNLYPVLVRPLLEYCVQVWSPYKQMHIDLIEGVQKRATRLVPGTKNMDYDQRLAYLKDLPKLEERRVRGDMIETYKILTGKEDTKWDRFFKFAPTRGDQDLARGLKLFHKSHKLDKRKYVFSHRVIRKWNELSREEVQSAKTSGFKEKYDTNEKERKKLISENAFTSGVRNYILRVFRPILPPRGQVA